MNPGRRLDRRPTRGTKLSSSTVGSPWVGEMGIILMRHSSRTFGSTPDGLPTLSYATSKRAFHEWLDVMPSNRIMWGGDANHAEGIYGATEMTRRSVAEVLAERVDRGDLREEHAKAEIGQQMSAENMRLDFSHSSRTGSGNTRVSS